jgi:sulfate-transporting ATPase
MAQYVFSMNRVGKIVPPKRHILKDISLSPSSLVPRSVCWVPMAQVNPRLLKIMAGVDKEIEGEATPMAGPQHWLFAPGTPTGPHPDGA